MEKIALSVKCSFHFTTLTSELLNKDIPPGKWWRSCIYKVGNPIVEFSGFYIEVID
jgi:hypothetical protein